jgi:hypothetical protein
VALNNVTGCHGLVSSKVMKPEWADGRPAALRVAALAGAAKHALVLQGVSINRKIIQTAADVQGAELFSRSGDAVVR